MYLPIDIQRPSILAMKLGITKLSISIFKLLNIYLSYLRYSMQFKRQGSGVITGWRSPFTFPCAFDFLIRSIAFLFFFHSHPFYWCLSRPNSSVSSEKNVSSVERIPLCPPSIKLSPLPPSPHDSWTVQSESESCCRHPVCHLHHK